MKQHSMGRKMTASINLNNDLFERPEYLEAQVICAMGMKTAFNNIDRFFRELESPWDVVTAVTEAASFILKQFNNFCATIEEFVEQNICEPAHEFFGNIFGAERPARPFYEAAKLGSRLINIAARNFDNTSSEIIKELKGTFERDVIAFAKDLDKLFED